MKIDKVKNKWGNGKTYLYHYYKDSQTKSDIYHGLHNSVYNYGIGYRYHDQRKGFSLKKIYK